MDTNDLIAARTRAEYGVDEMKTPESYEKDEIKKYLTSIGAWYFMPFMSGYGASGQPDIVACINGTFWGIEVKRPGKEPTKLQLDRIHAIGRAGGMATWGTGDKVIKEISIWRSSRG